MTQDEIIDMADKAKLGSKAHFGFVIYQTSGTKELEAFAKLVAAKEREACAKVCDDIDKSHWGCEVKASWCSDAIRARGEA